MAEVMFRSVRDGAVVCYTTEQVVAWLPDPPTQPSRPARATDVGFVAVDDSDRVIAYGDIEPTGHIDHLSCAPEFIGTGVGSAVYDAIEAAEAQGIEALFVEASESARRPFARKGFEVVERREFERYGVSMHNYAMVKRLSAPPTR